MSRGGISGITIARLFGITIRVHATWLIIFFLFTWSLAYNILPMSSLADDASPFKGMRMVSQLNEARQEAARPGSRVPPVTVDEAFEAYQVRPWPNWQYWVLGAIGSLSLFLCVLAHELSHSLVARRKGIPVEGITLFLFGGVSQLKDEATSPRDEFEMAAAGPAMSVLLGVLFGAIYYGFGNAVPAPARALTFYLALINGMLAAFNLLPGFPLDGGRILRAILWKYYKDMRRATAVAAWWGKAIGAGFITWGLVEFFVWGTMFGPIWLVVIGWFLRHAAKASVQQLAVRDTFAGLTVRDVIQPEVVTVEPDLALDRFVDEYLYRHKYRSFPVVEADRLVGMISVRDVQSVPRAEWPARTVRQAMHQVREENLVHPSDDLGSVFRKMAEEDKGHLPVVEDGRLSGIVTRHDIMTLIQLRTDLGGRWRPGTA